MVVVPVMLVVAAAVAGASESLLLGCGCDEADDEAAAPAVVEAAGPLACCSQSRQLELACVPTVDWDCDNDDDTTQ